MPDNLDLDKLAKLEAAATMVPWTAMTSISEKWFGQGDRRAWANGGGYIDRTMDFDERRHERQFKRFEDAAFVAALRNAAPALIAAARERDKLAAPDPTTPTGRALAAADLEAAELRMRLKVAREALAKAEPYVSLMKQLIVPWNAGLVAEALCSVRQALAAIDAPIKRT